MKSPRKLRTLLLWLTAAAVMTITFRTASTRTPVNQKPVRHTAYFSRVEAEPSAHLVEAALRKADFPQTLNPVERAALHQPLRLPNGITLIPDHSLFVEAIPVVEDPNLTWDPCLALNGGSGGNQAGAWTFNELMLAVAGTTDSNPQPAEQLLTNLLYNFANPNGVTIGNFTAKLRHSGPDFFNHWPVDQSTSCNNLINSGQCLALKNAPVHLNAIVNRVDVGQNGQTDQAGQLRFVFGVTMNPTNDNGGGPGSGNFCENQLNQSGSGNQSFNIILEYNVPSNISAQTWASQWAALSNDCTSAVGLNNATCAQQTFDPALNQIVQQVVALGAGGSSAPNGSALTDFRTNETELDGPSFTWEMRQFQLGQPANPNQLIQTGLSQTPDLSFDFADNDCTFSNQTPACSTSPLTVENLVINHVTQIENGTFNAGSATAASAINLTDYWDSSPSMSLHTSLYTPRVIFAASPQVVNGVTGQPDFRGGIDGTCNGCHGVETQTGFRQVFNRAASGTSSDQPSQLSGFLTGCDNGGTALTAQCPPPSPGCGVSKGGSACVFPLNSPGNEVVLDPVYGSGFNNTFGDVQRRVTCMNTILNNSGSVCCDGAGNLCTH